MFLLYSGFTAEGPEGQEGEEGCIELKLWLSMEAFRKKRQFRDLARHFSHSTSYLQLVLSLWWRKTWFHTVVGKFSCV